MAVDGGLGTRRQPKFLDAGAPDIAVDPTAVADYAAEFGNYCADTNAKRLTATSWAWEGLLWYATDTDLFWVYEAGAWAKIDRLTNLQLDTTNSTVKTITQIGSGMIVGNNTAFVTETVTFPVPFASVPRVIVAPNGSRAGAWNADGGNSAGAVAASTYGKTATTVGVGISSIGGSLSSGVAWYYDWIAIGVPAS